MCVGACGSAVAGRSGVELAPLQIHGRKWRDCSKCHYLCKQLMHFQVFDFMLLSDIDSRMERTGNLTLFQHRSENKLCIVPFKICISVNYSCTVFKKKNLKYDTKIVEVAVMTKL